MIASTPPMGWNSWNTFGRSIDEGLVLSAAEHLVSSGLAELGYRYVVIDDHWEAPERDHDGCLQACPNKFPHGIAWLAEQTHRMGLKFGIYSCAGTHTCGGELGSYGFEETDAQTFARWGVDYLKYDFCNVSPGVDGPTLYRRMGLALRRTGRPIVFSACEWGINEPWKWARGAGCHLWRTTGDINDSWESIKDIGFRRQAGLEAYAGPNGWNDPDMLVVGMRGAGNVAAGGCTEDEYRSHFVQWCMLASPLMLGCDLRSMDEFTLGLVGNPRLIAVNQDPLGIQAVRIAPKKDEWDWQELPVYAKPLSDGGIAVALYNLTDGSGDRRLSVAWETLGLRTDSEFTVLDLLTGEPSRAKGYLSVRVPEHGVAAFRIG